MDFLGFVQVGLGTAPYALPDYVIMNQSGYSWVENSLRPTLKQTVRVDAFNTPIHFANVVCGVGGVSQVTIDPTGNTGSILNQSGSVNGMALFGGLGLQNPPFLYSQFQGQPPAFNAPLALQTRIFPAGFGAVPQVNSLTPHLGFSDNEAFRGLQKPGWLWCASALDDFFGVYAAVLNPAPMYFNCFETNLGAITQLFTGGTDKMVMHSAMGVHRMFLPTGGSHGNIIIPFTLSTYNPLNTPLIAIPAAKTFGQAQLDAAFSNTATYWINNWWGGFVVVLNCGGNGPTGQKYEVAVCDETMSRYWLMKIVPKDSQAMQAINRNTGRWDVKIDVNGVVYFTSQASGDRLLVFNSFGFELAFPKVQFGAIPSIVLPCYNTCLIPDFSEA